MSKLGNMGLPLPAEADHETYKAHTDLGHLLEAHRIKSDPERYGAAIKYAREQHRALRAVSGPRAEGDDSGNY